MRAPRGRRFRPDLSRGFSRPGRSIRPALTGSRKVFPPRENEQVKTDFGGDSMRYIPLVAGRGRSIGDSGNDSGNRGRKPVATVFGSGQAAPDGEGSHHLSGWRRPTPTDLSGGAATETQVASRGGSAPVGVRSGRGGVRSGSKEPVRVPQPVAPRGCGSGSSDPGRSSRHRPGSGRAERFVRPPGRRFRSMGESACRRSRHESPERVAAKAKTSSGFLASRPTPGAGIMERGSVPDLAGVAV